MDHIIWSISYGPFNMVHVTWAWSWNMPICSLGWIWVFYRSVSQEFPEWSVVTQSSKERTFWLFKSVELPKLNSVIVQPSVLLKIIFAFCAASNFRATFKYHYQQVCGILYAVYKLTQWCRTFSCVEYHFEHSWLQPKSRPKTSFLKIIRRNAPVYKRMKLFRQNSFGTMCGDDI